MFKDYGEKLMVVPFSVPDVAEVVQAPVRLLGEWCLVWWLLCITSPGAGGVILAAEVLGLVPQVLF